MKNVFLFIISLFCCYNFISCSEPGPTETGSNKYAGSWLWLKTEGGFFTRIIKPKDGISVIISYDNFGKFTEYRNDSLKVIAGYCLGQGEHTQDKITYSNIITSDNFYFDSMPDYPAVQNDTLVLWDGMMDGFFSFYKRLY
ncbi:MAG: hypothetical protein WBV81_00430 [Ignavibacteriaceae bacterium]